MFKNRLIHYVYVFSFRRLILKNNMDSMKSVTSKNVNKKIENMERLLYSVLQGLEDVKGFITAQQTLARSQPTKQITERLVNEPSSSMAKSLKRKMDFNNDVSETECLTWSDEDFADSGNDNKKPKESFQMDSNGFVIVYTDGACENNGKFNAKAGLGVWFGPNHPLNVSKPVTGRATNNVGEIQACTFAINAACKAGVKKLCIHTDSQFVINSMTKWISGWKKRGWKLADGGPVKNKDDFIDLERALSNLDDLKWNYVKGHSGILGNEEADRLARNGAAQFKKSSSLLV